MTIRFLIEGHAADRAADDLAAIPGLAVQVESHASGKAEKDPFTLAAIATIVGVAGGITTIADQILKWRDRWREAHSGDSAKQEIPVKPVETIILVIDDRRLLLDNVSAETLAKALGQVPDPPQ